MYPQLRQFQTRDRELEQKLEYSRVYRERGHRRTAGSRGRRLPARVAERSWPASHKPPKHAKETS